MVEGELRTLLMDFSIATRPAQHVHPQTHSRPILGTGGTTSDAQRIDVFSSTTQRDKSQCLFQQEMRSEVNDVTVYGSLGVMWLSIKCSSLAGACYMQHAHSVRCDDA